ncbi:hypothetical protein CMI37_08620 [Candidatus Pacearchaeota archaeon]|nr:hypothetical protein [Candidatus Pacearchaeota archaeon]
MSLLNLIVFYLGVYGIAWSIRYAKPLEILRIHLNNINKSFKDLIACIVCISFWTAIPFTILCFNDEAWFTQVLITYSAVSFTWILASILED